MNLDWQVIVGPTGALAILSIVGYAFWKKLDQKDAELTREHEARLEDARQYTESLLKMARGVHTAIDRLEEVSRQNPQNSTTNPQNSTMNGQKPPTS